MHTLTCLLLIFFIGTSHSVLAQKMFVANNAIDSSTCGTRSEPCRSVSRAIDHANSGDTIVVGPGSYGDLNGDGDFDDPGEEDAEVGCWCMILIDKRLTLVSQDGAGMTILDAARNDVDVVRITADKVIFGLKNKGFTLTSAGGGIPGVEGNMGLNVVAASVKIRGNLARGNTSAGFLIGDSVNVSGHTVKDNIATGNGAAGFTTSGAGHNVRNNIANGNLGSGFSIFGDGQNYYHNNVSVGNGRAGFTISLLPGASLRFYRNSAIGNTGVGIYVSQRAENVEINRNNIFGNLGVEPSPTPNCGLVNQSSSTIDATKNFWGAASGPGSDPADDAGPGSGCDVFGSSTVKPFLLRPVREHASPRFNRHDYEEFKDTPISDDFRDHFGVPFQYNNGLRE
jgi:hypothetical protein